MLTAKFDDIAARVIEGFPYVDRHCPYCEQECSLTDAVHLMDTPEHYKALFICNNKKCGAYDEDARKAYARVYYSSQEAFDALELHRIWRNEAERKLPEKRS